MLPSDNDKIRQANNFDFLRFVSSLFVIISHSYSLTGNEDKELLMQVSRRTYHFSSLGLICFFVISGYLVSQSLFNSSSILNYAWKRFLRIVPGLCGVILFSVLLIGPVFTSLDAGSYFLSPRTWSYLRNVIFILPFQWDIPGLFTGNPDKSVNGSIWTLGLEGKLYIVLALFFIPGLFRKKIVLTSIFFLVVIASPWILVHLQSPIQISFHFALFFFAGMVAALYKEKIRYNKWLFLLAIVIFTARCFSEAFNPLTFVAFPYIVLYLAQLPLNLNHFGRRGDFSYGMFLYAFPVQQCIVQLMHNNISPGMMILLSIAFTLPFAVLSWKLIESKALKYKHLIK